MPKGIRIVFTNEQKQFLVDNVSGTPYEKLTNMFNEKFGTNYERRFINSKCTQYGLRNGIDAHYPKGLKPFNKGKKWNDYLTKEQQEKSLKTCYKKGHRSANARKIGAERIDSDGYIYVKVSDGKLNRNWKQKHYIVYEEYHKKEIPKGHKILFLDGNKMNLNIDNLALVSDRELLYMNRRGYVTNSSYISEAYLNLTRLELKIIDRKKSKNGE